MMFELAPFDLPADYGEGVVSLADVKAHLQVLASDQDDLIGLLRDAAVDMVERYCGVRLGVCSGLIWRAERLSARVCLGVWPVTAVSAVNWLDSAGDVMAGDVAAWRVGLRDEIVLKPGQGLPAGVAAGVEISFDAGFTDANRPAALVMAVKLFTAHLFANREVVVTGTISSEIPMGFKLLCGAYRMPVI